ERTSRGLATLVAVCASQTEGSTTLRRGWEQLKYTHAGIGKTQPKALPDLNGLCREAIEALPAAVYMTDGEGRITFYNEVAAVLWGCRPELADSKFCGSWKLYRPDGTPLPHDQCPMAMALHQKRPIRGMEAVAERPDGTRIPFIPYPTPLFDNTGRLTGAVNMLVDISEQKRAEQVLAEREGQLAVFVERDITERKEAEEKLRRSEQTFRELLGALPAAIFVTDAEGRITYYNQAAVELWGKSPELGKDRWSDLARPYCADGKPAKLRNCPTEIALRHGKCVRGLEA